MKNSKLKLEFRLHSEIKVRLKVEAAKHGLTMNEFVRLLIYQRYNITFFPKE
jgi:predicted HicB family RNase H-like nuclease